MENKFALEIFNKTFIEKQDNEWTINDYKKKKTLKIENKNTIYALENIRKDYRDYDIVLLQSMDELEYNSLLEYLFVLLVTMVEKPSFDLQDAVNSYYKKEGN